MSDEERIARERLSSALHHLWTKYAFMKESYVKSEWIELDNAIYGLVEIIRKEK